MDKHEHPGVTDEDKDLFRPDEAAVVSGGDDAVPMDSMPTQMPEVMPQPEVKTGSQAKKPGPAIAWTASEYITHSKSVSWYVALGAAMVVIAAITWLITRDSFSTITVAIALSLLGIYAGRKPREQSYILDSHGLTIGSRHYAFGDFRSFSVIPEGVFASIQLTPLKRFAMYVTVYFDPKDQSKIINLLNGHLPVEEPRVSLVDNLMRQIRF